MKNNVNKVVLKIRFLGILYIIELQKMSFIRPFFMVLGRKSIATHDKLSKAFLHSSCYLKAEGLPITMPSLSPTMTEGRVVKWLKEEGDAILPGDVICDVETDKAVVSFDLEEEGTLAKILVGSDVENVKVGTLIAVMAADGDDWKTVTIPTIDGAPVEPQTEEAATVTAPVSTTGPTCSKLWPSVRLLLEQYNLQASTMSATGPQGQLLKGDVLKHISANALQPAPQKVMPAPGVATTVAPTAATPTATVTLPSAAPFTDIPVSNMRRTIAKRLTESKTGIHHAYATVECAVDELLAVRGRLKAGGSAVSVNDFVIKAAAKALHGSPVNCVWQGEELVLCDSVDVAVAVATPSGLITPVVRRAEGRGVASIGAGVREMAGRARMGKLLPEEYMGGSFTISNLGMFGITQFTAIINPPQCAILAVGGGTPVLGPDGTCTQLRLTLSYDSAAVTPSDAAAFLSDLRGLLEVPETLLL